VNEKPPCVERRKLANVRQSLRDSDSKKNDWPERKKSDGKPNAKRPWRRRKVLAGECLGR